ncbi:MAG: hypothetical protein JWQ10_2753 [Herbaspirillum sp.]|nr:hypothetical protein [Herbaspirillum sp.]
MAGIKNTFAMTASISAAILLIGSIAACDRFQSANSLISEAKQYQQKGDSAAAEIQLKNVLQKDPDNVEARFLLGKISLESGDAPSAEKELRKASSLGMKPDQVMPFLAQSLLMQGQFQKVLDDTAQAPAQSDIAALRGNAYLGLGKTIEAKASFDNALQSNPNLAVALIGRARGALIEKDIQAATGFIEQAIAKNPGNVDVLLFKANLLRGQGEVEPAMTVLNQALAIKPGSMEAHVIKADLEIRQKKYDGAKADIAAVQKVSPKNLIAPYMLSVLNYNQGKNAEALSAIQKVLAAAPDYMPGVLLAGAIQYDLGSMRQAELHLSKYLDKNPKDIYARKLLSSTLLKSGQNAKAMTTLEPALKASPQDPELLALAGEISMADKHFTIASDYFEKASALAPQSAKLHMALGLSNLGLGQNATAVSQLEMANSLDKKSSQAGILLMMTHVRLKEFDQAIAVANALEKEQPGNPLLQNLKGGAYLGKDDVADASASFQKALSIDPTYFPATANLALLDLHNNNPAAAKKRFETLLDTDKKNINAMTALASLALSQKHKDEATRWLERASGDNPDSLPAAMQLALHYSQIDEKQKALTLVRKLQAANPADPSVLDLLAQMQFSTDDKSAALQSYDRLANLLPDSAPVQLKIASIQAGLKNMPAAMTSVKKALLLQPDYADAEILQAGLYISNGDAEQAIGMATQMQKQPEQAALGFELEGNILTVQKKPDSAAKAFERAFTANPQNIRLLMRLHASLMLAGRNTEADARASQWFKEHPSDVAFHLYLAESYMAQKLNKAAIEQYELVLRQQPKNAGALNNLAWAYQQEQDPRAMETAEKAYQAAASSPPVMDTLGWMLVERGDTGRGLQLLDKASAAAPDALDIRYHLVLGLLRSGDKSRARTELEQILATGKSFPQIDEARALLKKI